MSRSQSETSPTDRKLLQFIRYRTRISRTGTFFGDNDYIAKFLGIQPITAKQSVNKLSRLGYLNKVKDKDGRRHLTYTGKPYIEEIENMSNYDKRVLKRERDDYKRNAVYYQSELQSSEFRIKKLEQDTNDLTMKLHKAEMRVFYLEQFLYEQGYTKEQIKRIAEEQCQKIQGKQIESSTKSPVFKMPKTEEIPPAIKEPTLTIDEIMEQLGRTVQ